MGTQARTAPRARVRLRSEGLVSQAAVVASIFMLATVASLVVALLNQPYFDVLNGFVGARDPIPRALLFSSWPVLVSVPFVLFRPAAFGIRIPYLRPHVRLVLLTCIAYAILTATVLTLTGRTPYNDASLFVESVLVPVTEELLFRGVVLGLLILVFTRLQPPGRAVILAIATDAFAFGAAHLANATSLDLAFVLPQAVFAVVVGAGCAVLAVRTRSVLPAMLLHGVVNAVVVLI